MTEREITIEIKKPEVLITIIVLSIFLFLELKVTFENPIVFGDEGYHAGMAQWIFEEKEYPIWTPIHQTKLFFGGFSRPPLLNITLASFLYIFGGIEGIIRFLIPFMAFLTGLVVFLLGKELYNEKVGFIASVITMTIPSFVTYSVLVYTDVLVTFYTALFFLFFVLYSKRNNRIYLISSGILGALAFLTKTSGFAAFIFVIFISLYYIIKKRKLEFIKNMFILFVIMLIFTSTFFLRNLFYYKTPICGFPYVSKFFDVSGCMIDNFEEQYKFEGKTEMAGTELSTYKMGLMNYLDFAYGNIWFVVLGLCAGLFVLMIKLEKSDIMILLFFLIFLPVFYYIGPGRAEDAARFGLAWSPFIALIASRWFEKIYEFIKRYQKYLAIIVFIIIIFFSYQNLTGKLGIIAQVKQFSPSFFEACEWVKRNTPKNITITTVWGHRVAYNCQRNTVGHVPDIFLSRELNYTKEVANKLGITHIFVQKFSLSNQILSERYNINSVQFFEDNPETFKKVYENGPPLEQCLQQGGCDGNIFYEIVY